MDARQTSIAEVDDGDGHPGSKSGGIWTCCGKKSAKCFFNTNPTADKFMAEFTRLRTKQCLLNNAFSLVDLVRNHALQNAQLACEALSIMSGLCVRPENKKAFIEANGCRLILELLSEYGRSSAGVCQWGFHLYTIFFRDDATRRTDFMKSGGVAILLDLLKQHGAKSFLVSREGTDLIAAFCAPVDSQDALLSDDLRGDLGSPDGWGPGGIRGGEGSSSTNCSSAQEAIGKSDISLIVHLMHIHANEHMDVAKSGLRALEFLAVTTDVCKEVIALPTFASLVIELLKTHGRGDADLVASGLSLLVAVIDVCASHPHAAKVVVDLLSEHKQSINVAKIGIAALLCLCERRAAQSAVAEAGGCAVLIQVVRDQGRKHVDIAYSGIKAIHILLATPVGATAFSVNDSRQGVLEVFDFHKGKSDVAKVGFALVARLLVYNRTDVPNVFNYGTPDGCTSLLDLLEEYGSRRTAETTDEVACEGLRTLTVVCDGITDHERACSSTVNIMRAWTEQLPVSSEVARIGSEAIIALCRSSSKNRSEFRVPKTHELLRGIHHHCLPPHAFSPGAKAAAGEALRETERGWLGWFSDIVKSPLSARQQLPADEEGVVSDVSPMSISETPAPLEGEMLQPSPTIVSQLQSEEISHSEKAPPTQSAAGEDKHEKPIKIETRGAKRTREQPLRNKVTLDLLKYIPESGISLDGGVTVELSEESRSCLADDHGLKTLTISVVPAEVYFVDEETSDPLEPRLKDFVVTPVVCFEPAFDPGEEDFGEGVVVTFLLSLAAPVIEGRISAIMRNEPVVEADDDTKEFPHVMTEALSSSSGSSSSSVVSSCITHSAGGGVSESFQGESPRSIVHKRDWQLSNSKADGEDSVLKILRSPSRGTKKASTPVRERVSKAARGCFDTTAGSSNNVIDGPATEVKLTLKKLSACALCMVTTAPPSPTKAMNIEEGVDASAFSLRNVNSLFFHPQNQGMADLLEFLCTCDLPREQALSYAGKLTGAPLSIAFDTLLAETSGKLDGDFEAALREVGVDKQPLVSRIMVNLLKRRSEAARPLLLSSSPFPPLNRSQMLTGRSKKKKNDEDDETALLEDFVSAELPLPGSKKYHLFLSHAWSNDAEGRDNHHRVKCIAQMLKQRGYKVWLDEEQLFAGCKGIGESMAQGIEESSIFLAFLTEAYIKKVQSGNESDSCYKEFSYAYKRVPERMVPVLMDSKAREQYPWKGLLGFLGDKLFCDASSDDPVKLSRKIGELEVALKKLLSETSSSSSAAGGGAVSESFSSVP